MVRDDGFRAARWLGVALIALQALILSFLSGAQLFPAAAVVLACVIGLMRHRLRLDRLTFQLLSILMAIGFLLYHMLWPFPFPEESLFLRTPEAHAIARFLIGLQLLGLAVQQPSGRPPIWLAGVGAMCLPFASNAQLAESRHDALVPWIVAFVAVAALYSSQIRRRFPTSSMRSRLARSCLVITALLISIVLGGGSAMALRRYERNIETMLQDFLGQGHRIARVGFPPSGRMNDVLTWKTLNADQVALRVIAGRKPDYLRGKAFDAYQTPEWEYAWRSWSSSLQMDQHWPVPPVPELPPLRGGESVYQLSETAIGPWEQLDIWPESTLGGYLFSSLEAAYVAVDSPYIARDDHSNLMATERNALHPYSIFASASSPEASLSDEMRVLLTSLDSDIENGVRDLVHTLFADCPTPRAKMERVQSWFRTNFRYRLGVSIPRGTDALIYFLTERPPAHCEFFATGTAVLLKAAGVPCRYVTGFVIAEENTVGGYWIARNKDAHAWVEAYDDMSRQWVIVESTPAVGIPVPRGSTYSSQLLDSLQQYWVMLKETIRTIGVAGILTGVARLAWSIPALVSLLVVVVGFLLWRNPPFPVLRFRKADKRLRGIHAALRQLDRQAKRHGLTRRADETLLQFSERVRGGYTEPGWRSDLARCYDLYATLRFRGQIGPESIQLLRQAATKVHSPSD